jgi:putative copper resistance protein D
MNGAHGAVEIITSGGSAVLAHAGPGDLPPPISWARIFTGWTFDPVASIAILALAVAYLLGVRAMHRAGNPWPWSRTVCFVGLGLGSLVVATQSVLGTYDTVLVSAHMAQHMVLAMITPVFLALGAPVTLALRTLPARPRRWLVAALHSRLARVLSFPVVAGVLFVANPWILYFTPVYEATLRNAALHDLLHLHFVIVGCLFAWPLLGLDPVPGRVSHPLRLLIIFMTLPFHAFLGITIMGQTALLGGDWYIELDRGWPPSPQVDQQWAGGLLWSSGDLVGLLFFGVLFVQWLRASRLEAAREDRRLDRLEARERAAHDDAAREHGGDSTPYAGTPVAAGTIAADQPPRSKAVER